MSFPQIFPKLGTQFLQWFLIRLTKLIRYLQSWLFPATQMERTGGGRSQMQEKAHVESVYLNLEIS